MVGQTNIKTCRVSELKSKQFVSKGVAKHLKYRILFKAIPTILRLGYRDASLITLYLVVMGISIPKIR